jgi:hypothetical protein
MKKDPTWKCGFYGCDIGSNNLSQVEWLEYNQLEFVIGILGRGLGS